MDRQRKYWVVSPNVNAREVLLESWKHEILKRKCAFMGWGKDHQIGRRFANEIRKGDLILIARRHNGKPDVVGFGIATEHFEWSSNDPKDDLQFDSMRELRPFRPLSRAPKGIPFMDGLRQTMALAQLHPERDEKQKQICDWMQQELIVESACLETAKDEDRLDPRLDELQHQDESEYQVRGQSEVVIARRDEAKLINGYINWLEKQGRKLHIAKYGTLRCDAFEEERNNLIEAKRSSEREHIRMAVGQLLDYAFQGRNLFADPHLAILLPNKPAELGTQFGWLKEHNIHVIWKDMDVFLDNCDGQFT